jgi:hypothetical protein
MALARGSPVTVERYGMTLFDQVGQALIWKRREDEKKEI